MMELNKLKNRIGNVWPSDDFGIFRFLDLVETDDPVPWKDLEISDTLDYLYKGNHGFKITSPLVDGLLNSDGVLTFDEELKLATICHAKFIQNWKNIWDVLAAEYDPISNYDMVEDGTDENTGTITDTSTRSGTDKTSTNSDIKVSTAGETKSNPGDVENLRSGFNSSSYVNDGKQTEAQSTVTLDPDKNYTKTAANKDNNYNETTYGSANTNVRSFNGNKQIHHLTRKGNIGVTTSQQMQQSSLELWKYNYFETVMNDIDMVLTCNMY